MLQVPQATTCDKLHIMVEQSIVTKYVKLKLKKDKQDLQNNKN